jgi:hypothetical protein
LNPNNSGAVSDGFTAVTYEKPAPGYVSVNTVKQPLIGVINSANLPIVSKKEGS